MSLALFSKREFHALQRRVYKQVFSAILRHEAFAKKRKLFSGRKRTNLVDDDLIMSVDVLMGFHLQST
jgi:hypothetical protein